MGCSGLRSFTLLTKTRATIREWIIAKFHYTGPTGPDQTKSADFVGDLDLRPGSREKVRAGPCGSVRVGVGPVGSGRARVVECSLYPALVFLALSSDRRVVAAGRRCGRARPVQSDGDAGCCDAD